MRIALENALAVRGNFRLRADGVFEEGIHLVAGETGSGKSTFGLLLTGCLGAASGRVVPEGISSRMIAFPFPDFHITGATLEEECHSWGLSPEGVLGEAGLSGRERSDPFTLSRGELKRLVLSCILARQYDLLVLDEPFSSLDCTGKARLSRRLSARRAGITILLTHERAFLPDVDYRWEIRDGSLAGPVRMPAVLPRGQGIPGDRTGDACTT